MKNDLHLFERISRPRRIQDFLIDKQRTKAGSAESINALFKKSFELIKFCDDGERKKNASKGEATSNHLIIFPPRQSFVLGSHFKRKKMKISPPLFIDFICRTQCVRLTDIK